MNAKTLGAFLLGAFLMQGCVVKGGHSQPPPQPVGGDVTVTWSFSGLNCQDVPDVRSVHIVIPGETIQNAGVFPCLVDNYPGIVLHDFDPGSYDFTIEGLGYDGYVLFESHGNFVVNGNTRVTVDLTPEGQPNSYAYLSWRFPPNQASQNPTCDQAGVTTVKVTIDGVPVSPAYHCEDGTTAQGVATPYLAPGNHDILIEAVDDSNYRYYYYQGTLQTFAYSPASQIYDLKWSVGGASVSWTFTEDGNTSFGCNAAGVDTVYVNFQDQFGNFVYPDAGDQVTCGAKPVMYNYLQGGTYKVFVQATGPGGVAYSSNMDSPPQITVIPGEFTDGTNNLITLTAYRTN